MTIVGKHTYGHKRLTIRSWGEDGNLKIGSFCSLADNIQIFLGGNHRTDWISTFPFGHIPNDNFGVEPVEGHPHSNGNVEIGNDVWIGSGAIIMSGVKIGDGAVVGAFSVVNKDIGPYEIWAGNPCKFIRSRFSSYEISCLQQIKWWDLDDSEIKDIIPLLVSNKIQDLIEKFYAKI